MSILKSCNSCISGRHMNFTNDIICPFNGVVSKNYTCYKYRRNDIHYIFLNSKIYTCSDCSHFHIKTDQLLGKCTLFSLRTITSSKKKACAKFSRHKEKIEV